MLNPFFLGAGERGETCRGHILDELEVMLKGKVYRLLPETLCIVG